MLFEKIDTVIVRVRDLVTAQAWYEEVLDLRPNFFDEEQRLVVMETGGDASITLWERGAGDAPPPPPKTGSYPIFFVEDLERAHELLENRSVDVTPIESQERTGWFGFSDPDGNWLEVCTY